MKVAWTILIDYKHTPPMIVREKIMEALKAYDVPEVRALEITYLDSVKWQGSVNGEETFIAVDVIGP